MEQDERDERVADLWRATLAKAKGAGMVLNKFNGLNRRIYIHGSTKKHEDLELQEGLKPLRIILMQDSKLLSFWNIVMMLLLLYTATYIPFQTAFIDGD